MLSLLTAALDRTMRARDSARNYCFIHSGRSHYLPQRSVALAAIPVFLSGLAPGQASEAAHSPQTAPGVPVTWAKIEYLFRYTDLPQGVVDYGDTFMPAWADDDTLYVTSCDTSGWGVPWPPSVVSGHNLEIGRLNGDPNNQPTVHGHDVNPMPSFGHLAQQGADHRSWKVGGLASIGGNLYLSVNRHDPSGHLHGGWADNGSILMSADHGQSWYNHIDMMGPPPHVPSNMPPPIENPMFPFSAFPFVEFVLYGKDGIAPNVDNANTFVYAYSSDSLTNVHRLMRVNRDDLPNLRASDWQYYVGGDGMLSTSWLPYDSSNVSSLAFHLLPNNSGSISGAIVYDAPLGRYLMLEWDGPAGGLFLYEAPHPWGGWTRVRNWPDIDARFTSIPNKFISADGNRLWLFYSSNYTQQATYTLWMAKLDLEVGADGAEQLINIATIQASNGKYLSAKLGGGDTIKADQSLAIAFETYTVMDINGPIFNSGDQIRFVTNDGQHFVTEHYINPNDNPFVDATFTTHDDPEFYTFRMNKEPGGSPGGRVVTGDHVTFVTGQGNYLWAENGVGGRVRADGIHDASSVFRIHFR
jgi:hypothetical protein